MKNRSRIYYKIENDAQIMEHVKKEREREIWEE
jgi:hypothetical protein